LNDAIYRLIAIISHPGEVNTSAIIIQKGTVSDNCILLDPSATTNKSKAALLSRIIDHILCVYLGRLKAANLNILNPNTHVMSAAGLKEGGLGFRSEPDNCAYALLCGICSPIIITSLKQRSVPRRRSNQGRRRLLTSNQRSVRFSQINFCGYI